MRKNFIFMVLVVMAFFNCSRPKAQPDNFTQFTNIDKIHEGYQLLINRKDSPDLKEYIISISRGLSRKDILLT